MIQVSAQNVLYDSHIYNRLDTGNSKSFVGKVLLHIEWDLNVHFKYVIVIASWQRRLKTLLALGGTLN